MSEQDDSPKKGMSFKDRIAMFNQPKAPAPAPGPPPRATKPRAFKWKTSGEAEEGSSKTLSVAEVPPQPPTPTPGASGPPNEGTSSEQPAALTDQPVTRPQASGAPLEPVSSAASGASVVSAEDSIKHKGFSAEDARQSAGSLKERIALLSGLKVDKPDAPGRAPKPWRKKTQEPVEGDDQPVPAPEVTSPSLERPQEAVSSVVGAEEGSGEDAKDSNVVEETVAAQKDAVEAHSTKPTSETAPPSGEEKHNIALPAMPTRARGPQRKARGGTASPAVASPTTGTTPSSEPTRKTEPTKSESIPSVTDIGSPSAGPEELGNPIAAADIPSDEKPKGQSNDQVEREVRNSVGEDTISRSTPKRTSTNLLARSVPLPPPTAATPAEENNDEVHEDREGTLGAEDEEVQSLQAGIAEQSLDEGDQTSGNAPASAPSPMSRPPAPPALDTAVSLRSGEVDTPIEVTSPTSANTNRRSMTRPPVPSAYSQDSAPPSASPRSSFDNRSQRSSIVESHRGSLMMSPTQPEVVMAEPEDLAGDREFANPALDSKDKGVVLPSVSKPFDTESSAPPESPKSPQRQGSMPTPQQKRTSGIKSSENVGSGTTPVRTASAVSQKSTGDLTVGKDEPETNISAMKAYRSAPEEESQQEDNEEEEEEYEDPEVARRQALAKRMAAMGGMKIGMLPQMPSMLKRKKTLPKEADQAEHSEEVTSGQPAPAAPVASPPLSKDGENHNAERPPARTAPSFKPPTGAFVLPMPGRPTAPPPSVPPPAVPPPPTPGQDEDVEEEPRESIEQRPEDDSDGEEQEDEDDIEDVEAADDTGTQPMEEDETEELQALPPLPPPPMPAARPPPPPPTGQSFIETDTDTDGGASEKRNSLASSTGVGSLSDFPAPPAGAPPVVHARTQSSASRYSSQDQPDTLYEESESTESHDAPSEQAETILPPRPARAPPQLDTSVGGSGGRAPSRRESMAEPASPSPSVHSYSQRSLPETPVSPSGRNASQERFGALSPTASHSSKRSSAVLAGQQGGLGNIQPGLNNEYLAYISVNSSRTKSRDVDGPLAHTLNDIAYTYRNDPANFGTIVYRMLNTGVKGQVPELDFHGRIEPGCVFFAWDAKFDRGLGRSSLKVGSAEVPHVGIVAEGVKDIKKAKVKVVELVQGRHNVETYKLDDLKSGLVEIRRLA